MAVYMTSVYDRHPRRKTGRAQRRFHQVTAEGRRVLARQRKIRSAFVEAVRLVTGDARPDWAREALSDFWQDLRYAARTFWKQPAFAAAAVLTLALGIGATTAIFSVVYGVLLKPLPFHEPERLVSVRQHAPHGAGTNHGPATYLTYRENQSAFEAIGAWDPTEVSITGGGDPERVQALLVSAATLPLLRVQPVVGRFFSAEDDTPGNPLRVVLTYGYWQRRFGGAENVVGQPLVIDGRPAEVIGVLPSSFKFLRTRPDIVLPMPLDVERAPRNQLRVSGARPAEAGRHAGPGQRRCGAHDLASTAGLCEIGVAAERAPAGR